MDFEISMAGDNWKRWHEVFEHRGPPSSNPLLTNPGLFEIFVREYSVRRTIRRGKSDELRRRLSASGASLLALVSDGSGRELDDQEKLLRREYGTLLGVRSIRSALSKIVAFLAPDTFVAWDQYARRGTNIALKRSGSTGFDGYAAYLADINTLLRGPLGDQIRAACIGSYPTEYAAEHNRFHRRVLDVHLMRIGGRDFNKSINARSVNK